MPVPSFASLAKALLLGFVVAALVGCATTLPQPAEAPPQARRWRDAPSWKAAGDETVEVLRGYLRVDTTNPPGNERRGAEYLGAVLKREGIPYEIVESSPGRGNVIAELRGSGEEKPLCLLSHIDVVTADAGEWPPGKGPLSATLDDKGTIWGRGALDMKGLGALELMTMVLLKRHAVPLKRSVFLLAVADEEHGGSGMRFLADERWGDIGCSHVLNEGGIGVQDLFVKGQAVYAISVAEKGILWLQMTAHGETGHGSTPMPGRAPDRLLRALSRLRARGIEPVIHPALYDLSARVGDDAGGLTGFVLERPTLLRAFALGKFMENPASRAALVDTISVTGFEGRRAPNVVPSEVSAILDCRLLPGTRPVDFFAKIRDVVDDPLVSFEAIAIEQPSESPWNDPFFDAIVRAAVDGRAQVVAGPTVSPGTTDSRLLRSKGVRAYGLVPFVVAKEDLKGIHGMGEHVSVENVHRGLRIVYRAVVDVAAK
jgi:acetylornithine deacetylase/succinyl-diaminopimelate desuccinylase-like protein